MALHLTRPSQGQQQAPTRTRPARELSTTWERCATTQSAPRPLRRELGDACDRVLGPFPGVQTLVAHTLNVVTAREVVLLGS
jgi:hypothetical protein